MSAFVRRVMRSWLTPLGLILAGWVPLLVAEAVFRARVEPQTPTFAIGWALGVTLPTTVFSGLWVTVRVTLLIWTALGWWYPEDLRYSGSLKANPLGLIEVGDSEKPVSGDRWPRGDPWNP